MVRVAAARHPASIEIAALLLKTDIRAFFPSIHYWRVRGMFFSLGYGERVSAVLARRGWKSPGQA